MNELNLYNTKNIKENNVSENLNNQDHSNHNIKDKIQSGGKMTNERLYRKRMLEQEKYIRELKEHIKQLESRIHV
jgi:hypothetical protein